jgi:hypothetical protein
MVMCALVNRMKKETDPREVESQDQACSQNDRGHSVGNATVTRLCLGNLWVGDYIDRGRADDLVVLNESAQLHLVGGPYFFAHGLDDCLPGCISYWYHLEVVHLRDIMPGGKLYLIHGCERQRGELVRGAVANEVRALETLFWDD